MPQQLIYTSAPRGLAAGRAGFCTVAMSAGLRESLALRLEQFSYFDHDTMSRGQIIRAVRVLDLRGSQFFVLSRLQDCGLDFTQRTNFIAHHLVFTPEEIREVTTPPDIFRRWNGWQSQWEGEPRVLPEAECGNLFAIPRREPPARGWARLSGDAMNALALVEANPTTLEVAGVEDDTLLELFAESLALIEVRERGDVRSATWQFTFTTALQPQDSVSDFRWRCVRGPLDRFPNLGGAKVLPLLQMRPARVSVEEASFARSGYQPPRITTEPRDVQATEGQPVTLRVAASGVPTPNHFQWFSIPRAGAEEPIANATGPELRLPNATRGVSRYCVKITNSRGDAVVSRIVQVSAEARPTPASGRGVRPSVERAEQGRRTNHPMSPAAQEMLDQIIDNDGVEATGRGRLWILSMIAVGLLVLTTGLAHHYKFWPFSTERRSNGQKTPLVGNNQNPSSTPKTNPSDAETKQQALQNPAVIVLLFRRGGLDEITMSEDISKLVQHVFDSGANSVRIKTALLDGSKPEDVRVQSGVWLTGIWNNAQFILARRDKQVVFAGSNIVAARRFEFMVSTQSELGFKLLVCPNTNAPAVLNKSDLALAGAITTNLLQATAIHPQLVTRLRYLNQTKILEGLVVKTNVASLFEDLIDRLHSNHADLTKQSNAVHRLKELRDDVVQKIGPLGNINGFWGEVEAVCQMAARGQVQRETVFGFNGDIEGVSREQSSVDALRAIENANSKFLLLAQAALKQDGIMAIANIAERNDAINIDKALQSLRQEMEQRKREIEVDRSKLRITVAAKDQPNEPLIEFSIK